MMWLQHELLYSDKSINPTPRSTSSFISRSRVVVFLRITILIFISLGSIGAVGERKNIGENINDMQSEDIHSINMASPITTSNGISHFKSEMHIFECRLDDKECEMDRLGFDAIRSLHLLIDDDHNGNVDLSESDEFLRDELQYTDGFERQELFHNNDKLISVDDLWKTWKHSAVYNWTVDDMIEWLVQDVDLPQYSQVFYNFAIDGSALPRLVNSTSPLLVTLGVRNPVHKQKISLKAMDTILFGAPKRLHSYAKDVILFMAILLAIGISWFACLHHRYSQTQVKKMMKDLEALQNAEDALKKLSKELADAENPHSSLPPEKQEELRMLRQNSLRLQVPRLGSGDRSPSRQMRDNSPHYKREGEIKLKQAEEELANLRKALSDAENRLEIQQQLESQWSVPGELQAWLQLTYELEHVHFTAKRQAAERQLMAARDGCEKVRKRKQALFGALRMAHSNSLDDIDQSILDARAALEEVKQDLQERLHRWHTIEELCCFPVIGNSGLSNLKQILGRDSNGSGRLQNSLISPVTFEETDEDISTTDDNRESENLYNQIPEWPRQQIFAWAHRGRLNNWMKKKKTVANGHTATAIPVPGKTLTLLKQQQQTPAGSMSFLPHASKVTSPSNPGGGNVKSESGDSEQQESSSRVSPVTTTAVSAKNNAIFHLGDSSRHERSQSSASLSHFNPLLTNDNNHGHAQGRPNLNHAATVSSGLHISNSSGNLMTNKTTTKPGNLSAKTYMSASGNHLLAKTNHPQSSAKPTPSTNNHEASEETVPQNDAGNTNVNNQISPDLVVVVNSEHMEASEMADESPPSMNAQPHLINKHLKNVENDSQGTLPRNQSKTKISSSPESENKSLETDSLNDSRNGGANLSAGKKLEKRKTLLPKFLQKNKRKPKT